MPGLRDRGTYGILSRITLKYESHILWLFVPGIGMAANMAEKRRKTMDAFLLKNLSGLLQTGIFYVERGRMDDGWKTSESNPLCKDKALQDMLLQGADMQEFPFLYQDEFQVFFGCVAAEVGYCMVGPMNADFFDRLKRHRFYQKYHISEYAEKNLRRFTLMEVLQTMCIVARIVSGKTYTDQQLVDANHLASVTKEQEEEDKIRFNLRSEEEDIYRHSYQEELELLNRVKEGNVEEAVRLSKRMDVEIGRLGGTELAHLRNLLTIGAALCTRAAIEGGVSPYTAYRISGFYINKGAECKDTTQILVYRNHAVEELAKRVREIRAKQHTSSYTMRCKDYVIKHFREKIYLDQIADTLGISSSYLSRLFKRETGIRLQDYVNQVRVERAANLLVYSEESIPKIAQYVNFPSQSYFGKIFKAYKNMTPRQYRETYKPAEFFEAEQEM